MSSDGEGPGGNSRGPDGPGPVARRITSPLKNLIGFGDRGPPDIDRGEIKVEIEAEPDRLEEALAHAEDVGVTVESSFVRLIVARVRPGQVVRLAKSDAVRRINLFREPTFDGHGGDVSEGVEISNTDLLHDIGLTGKNVTIAVIDSQFNVDNDKFGGQVVGTIGDDSNFFDEDDDDDDRLGNHGTATAEIVADMAPDADLVLAANLGSFTIGKILDELEDHDNNDWDRVDVATHSISYPMSTRIDGKDSRSVRIQDFTDDGRLFMTSSGNEANGGNWDGEFLDSNNNDLMEFDDDGTERFALEKTWDPSDDEEVTDATGTIEVHWDEDWDVDDEEYEVRLYDAPSGGNELDSSQTNNPHETIDVPSGDAEKVYLEIENIDATGTEHFDIWPRGDLNLTESTPERSVTIPGVSQDPNTLAIAAVQATSAGRMSNAEDLKSYSSRGPTQDGRRGVDLAAASFVSQLDPQNDHFNGTSASTPHVGGAATVLFDPSIGASNDEIRQALFDAGRGIADSDVGPPGPDNPDIGFGYLDTRVARDLLESLMVQLDERWTADLSNRVQFARPAAGASAIFAGNLGADLVALDQSDGAEVWRQARAGALSDSSAVLVDGTLYVGSGGGDLYALDESGTIDWTYSTDSALTSSPAIEEDEGVVVVGANDGTVHGVDAGDGSEKWTTDVGEAVYADVAAANGVAVVNTRDGLVQALNVADGSNAWTLDTGTELGSSSPAISGGTVYVGASDLLALNAGSGAEEWRSGLFGGTAGSNPAVDPDRDIVYVGSADGDLYAFNTTNGSLEWQTTVGGGHPIAASPALAPERVVIAALNGKTSLIDTFIEPGVEIDGTMLGSETRSSPDVNENDVYIGSEGGEIFAFSGD